MDIKKYVNIHITDIHTDICMNTEQIFIQHI